MMTILRITLALLLALKATSLNAHDAVPTTVEDGYDVTGYLHALPDGPPAASFADPKIYANVGQDMTLGERLAFFSFSTAMRWAYFDLKNPTAEPLHFVLTQYFPVAQIRLVDATAPLFDRYSGLTYGSRAKVPSIFAAMELTVPPGGGRFFIGISTWGTPVLPVLQLHRHSTFAAFETRYTIAILGLSALVFAMALLNILTARALRSSIFLNPVMVGSAYIVLESFLNGTHQLLPPPLSLWCGKFWHFLVAVILFFFIRTMRDGLQDKLKEMPITERLLRVGLWLAFILPAATFFSPIWSTTMLVGCLFFYIALPILSGGLWRGRKGRHFFLFTAGYAVMVAISLLVLIQLLAPAPWYLSIALARLGATLLLSILFSVVFSTSISRIRATHQAMRAGLKGIIADRHVERLMLKGTILQGHPSSRRVTVLFVELVDFSLVSLDLSPEEGFAALKSNLDDICAIIHANDGIVDKSLEDGMIAFFCEDFMGIGDAFHEKRALTAAIAIQRHNLSKMAGKPDRLAKTLFPVRIGINTATVCIGNIGDENRFDIALAGDGVVMAKRYVAACEPNRIILGETTYAPLSPEYKEGGQCQLRFIPVKHQKGVVPSYEFDPFAAQASDEERTVRKLYWEVMNRMRQSPRIACGRHSILFNSEYGAMKLMDFSQGGFCLNSSIFLGKGVIIDLLMEDALTVHDASLHLLNPIKVETVWGAYSNQSQDYQLGVVWVGMNEAQSHYLLEALTKYFGAKNLAA